MDWADRWMPGPTPRNDPALWSPIASVHIFISTGCQPESVKALLKGEPPSVHVEERSQGWAQYAQDMSILYFTQEPASRSFPTPHAVEEAFWRRGLFWLLKVKKYDTLKVMMDNASEDMLSRPNDDDGTIFHEQDLWIHLPEAALRAVLKYPKLLHIMQARYYIPLNCLVSCVPLDLLKTLWDASSASGTLYVEGLNGMIGRALEEQAPFASIDFVMNRFGRHSLSRYLVYRLALIFNYNCTDEQFEALLKRIHMPIKAKNWMDPEPCDILRASPLCSPERMRMLCARMKELE